MSTKDAIIIIHDPAASSTDQSFMWNLLCLLILNNQYAYFLFIYSKINVKMMVQNDNIIQGVDVFQKCCEWFEVYIEDGSIILSYKSHQ